MSERTLDARRLLCPLPVIKVQNAVRDCREGDTLEVLCTDPGTKQDIPAWCRIYGHDIIDIVEHDNEIHFQIRVNEKRAKPYV